MPKSPDPTAILLTPDGAAARLSVGRSSIYALITQGRLKAVRLNLRVEGHGQLMVRQSDLELFVKSLPEIAA